MCLVRSQWSWSRCIEIGVQEHQALIIDFKKAKVLLRSEEGTWVLPGYLENEDSSGFSYEPGFVIKKTREVVGLNLEIWVLRQVWREETDVQLGAISTTLEKAVILLEHDSCRLPCVRGHHWVSLHTDVYHLFPEARRIIRQEMKWAAINFVPRNRLPWQAPGWMCKTIEWAKSISEEVLDTKFCSNVFVERSSPYGIVFWVDTTKGRVYVKCTPWYANDAAFTDVLSRCVPEYVSRPVAVDVQKQLMLTSHYGEILNPCCLNNAERRVLSRNYASLQKGTIHHTEELAKAGMKKFGQAELLDGIEWIINHPALGREILSNSRDVVSAIQNGAEKLRKIVLRLHESEIPLSVTHNDLFLSNVYRRSGAKSFSFFDWVEAYVAHPFAGCLNGICEETYLKEWHSHGPSRKLRELLSVGKQTRMIITTIIRLKEVEDMEQPEANDSLMAAKLSLFELGESIL